MKKIILLFFVLLSFLAHSQNVGINNDGSAPDNTAILDIKSNTKGLLIPRMTTLERTSIPGPALGLTVFDMDTYSYWMYRGDVNGGWAELQHTFQNYWSQNGIDIHNTNPGLIGIGTNSPGEKLTINAPNAAIQFMNSGTARGYLQVNGTDMKLGTYANNAAGKIIFNTRAVDRMRIDENGLVGIGTSTGTASLTLNATNPVLQLRNADVDKGFLRLSGNDFYIGTNAGNTTGNIIFNTVDAERMRLDESGNLGIGTTAPNARLHVNSTSATDPAIRVQINGTSRFIAASNGGVAIGGLFTPPSNGLRVIGESLFSDSVGIGTLTPTSTLTLNATGFNLFPTIEIQSNAEQIGYIRGEQNARKDIAVAASTADGRVILKATGNPFGVVVHKDYQVSIGSSLKATGYELSVNGRIMCENMTMLPSGSWPDYVFEDTYQLRSLAELKSFIEKNKHLPGFTPAREVEKNGIRLAETTHQLVEKVEELTLYILRQQEQIEKLQKQVQILTEK